MSKFIDFIYGQFQLQSDILQNKAISNDDSVFGHVTCYLHLATPLYPTLSTEL